MNDKFKVKSNKIDVWPTAYEIRDIPPQCYDQTMQKYEWLVEHNFHDALIGENEIEHVLQVYNNLFADRPRNV